MPSTVPLQKRSAKENLLLQISSWLLGLRRSSLPNIFLKPDDIISEAPLIGKAHDEEVVEALRFLGKQMPGLYVDIGANIGLMAVSMAGVSKRVECIEPNPLVANILRTNLALHCGGAVVHQYALGATAGEFRLFVPRKNMGGAFIREANPYSEDLLAKKEGFARLDESDYSIHDVPVKPYADGLQMLARVGPDGAVVKIDVEGFELQILEAILETFPALFESSSIAVVLECLDRAQILEIEPKLAKLGYGVFTIHVDTKPDYGLSLLNKLAKLFFGTHRFLSLRPMADGWVGNANYVVCPRAVVTA